MKRAVIASTLLLAGCFGDKPEPPPITIVTHEPPRVARECVVKDAAWSDLPDEAAKRSAVVRNYATNKAKFNEMIRNRVVCRASILSHGLPTQ